MSHQAPCCPEFAKALEGGSDNEGYGCLIRHRSGESFEIGCELAQVRFCPWCGAEVAADQDEWRDEVLIEILGLLGWYKMALPNREQLDELLVRRLQRDSEERD